MARMEAVHDLVGLIDPAAYQPAHRTRPIKNHLAHAGRRSRDDGSDLWRFRLRRFRLRGRHRRNRKCAGGEKEQYDTEATHLKFPFCELLRLTWNKRVRGDDRIGPGSTGDVDISA